MWDTAQCTGPLSLPPLIDRPAEPQHRAAALRCQPGSTRSHLPRLWRCSSWPGTPSRSVSVIGGSIRSQHAHYLLLLLPPVAPLHHCRQCAHATSRGSLQSKSFDIVPRDTISQLGHAGTITGRRFSLMDIISSTISQLVDCKRCIDEFDW